MDINVYCGTEICGKITVTEHDLMTEFTADCKITSLDITRLFIKNDKDEIPLGILMPKNNRYILTKKIPISNIKKYDLNNFTGYMICESTKSFGENFILKETIKDENLAKNIHQNIEKMCFEDHDEYSFLYQKNNKFILDFCIFACKVIKKGDDYFIMIKTNKKGEILV